MYSKELTKGTLQPIILTLISDKGKMYGYEITQEVKKITSKFQLTEFEFFRSSMLDSFLLKYCGLSNICILRSNTCVCLS